MKTIFEFTVKKGVQKFNYALVTVLFMVHIIGIALIGGCAGGGGSGSEDDNAMEFVDQNIGLKINSKNTAEFKRLPSKATESQNEESTDDYSTDSNSNTNTQETEDGETKIVSDELEVNNKNFLLFVPFSKEFMYTIFFDSTNDITYSYKGNLYDRTDDDIEVAYMNSNDVLEKNEVYAKNEFVEEIEVTNYSITFQSLSLRAGETDVTFRARYRVRDIEQNIDDPEYLILKLDAKIVVSSLNCIADVKVNGISVDYSGRVTSPNMSNTLGIVLNTENAHFPITLLPIQIRWLVTDERTAELLIDKFSSHTSPSDSNVLGFTPITLEGDATYSIEAIVSLNSPYWPTCSSSLLLDIK